MKEKKPKAAVAPVVVPEEIKVTPMTSMAPTNFLLTLPFEDRMKGFDAEYKALSNKWGIYHLPVTIFDDATIPGGRFGAQLPATNSPETTEPSTEVQ